MNDALLEMMRPINWPLFALVSARVAGLLLIAPLWSMRAIPALVRGAMAVVMTMMLLPSAGTAVLPASGAVPLLSLVAELLVGIAIGLTAAVFMHGLTVAAEVVSLQMGLSLGVAFGGMSDVGSPGIGQFYGQMALVMFAVLGGHVMLIVAVAHSLRELPPGSAMAFTDGAVAMLAAAAQPGTAVVNAGDGRSAHPTQGLLDVLSLRQAKGDDLARLKVAVVGDIRHSRVARSELHALRALGVGEIRACGPAALLRAQVLPVAQMPADVVRMHSRVECVDADGTRRTLTLVYPHEADSASGRVSVLAPVGSALLGMREGDGISWPRPGGFSRNELTSRSPNIVIVTVRGIGVAVSTR